MKAVKDQRQEDRTAGMIFMLNLIKQKGVKAAVDEFKRRGVYSAPLTYTDEQIDNFVRYVCENTSETVFALTFSVLCDEFGFGEKRLEKFREEFCKRYQDCLDLDYMGKHYVRLEDFAIDIKEKYKKLTLDIQRIAACQEQYDKNNRKYKDRTYLKGIINTLRIKRYYKAAEFLQGRLDKEEKEDRK